MTAPTIDAAVEDDVVEEAAPEVDETEAPEGGRLFETLMVVEGRWTGDERFIMVDALSWDGLLPMCLTIDHAGVTEVVGRVDEIARTPGNAEDERFIFGRGVMFEGSDLAGQVAEMIEGQFLRGVSVELDAIEDGGVDPEEATGWEQVVETARIRALSVVTTPAFAEAYITFGTLSTVGLPPAIDGPEALPADELPDTPDDDGLIIVASGGRTHRIEIPDVPPADWFAEPVDVDIEGALTVTDDGRVYGLLAPGGVPHNAAAYQGRTVPMGNVDYSRFTRGETIVAGGGRVVTGNVTMGCGHGSPMASSSRAVEHYDNTCSVAATVAVGERTEAPYGVWVAGALLPGVTADQVRRMMACQLSGHWMPVQGGGYELLAALLVPVPGFSMARRRASVTMRDGAMVASSVPVQFADDDDVHSHSCGCGGMAAELLSVEDTVGPRLAAIERQLAGLSVALRPMIAAATAALYADVLPATGRPAVVID